MATQKRYQNLLGTPKRIVPLSGWHDLYQGIKQQNAKAQQTTPPWVKQHDLASLIKTHQQYNHITWLGHASYLIQLNETNMLIDPFFSTCAGPFNTLGPKRFVPAALTIEQLPRIDIILITHNHYDHFDKPFLRQLKHKDHIKIICPLGLGTNIRQCGYHNITELGWHECVKHQQINITALPAYHYSRRGLFDHNLSWWCGYAICTDNVKLYHAGDTGYGDIFKQIGQDFGGFDYAMLGIGAYEPVSVMKRVHTNPKEALQMATDLRAKTLCPMHWGTIVLSSEPYHMPLTITKDLINTHSSFKQLQTTLTDIGDLISLP